MLGLIVVVKNFVYVKSLLVPKIFFGQMSEMDVLVALFSPSVFLAMSIKNKKILMILL